MGTGASTTVWQLGAMLQEHVDSAQALEDFLRSELGVSPPSLIAYPTSPNVPSSGCGWRQALEQLRWLELDTLQMYEAALGSDSVTSQLRGAVLVPGQYRSLRCYRRLELGLPTEARFEPAEPAAIAAE